jgi:DNA-binding NarL/FixJ family response regulator
VERDGAFDGGSDRGELAAVHDALARHDWTAAYALALAGAGVLVPGDDRATSGGEAAGDWLDALAEAAWWVGLLDECIAARQRAYACYEEAGAARRAGQCAVWLFHHWCFKGKPAIASGWLRRGRRALEHDTACDEYAYLLLYEAELVHGSGDLSGAMALVRAALERGRRARAPDLEAQALQAMGRILIDEGRPADGLAHLDEAMLFAVEGRLSPFVTGKVYCSLLSACHDLGDVRRATEWVEAVGAWADTHPFTVFPGLCRLHRADLMQWRGEWARAEEEARRAGAELAESFVPNAAAAFAEVGEICRRRGDLDAAEEAFARAEALTGRPAAGVARLRLEQGQATAASAIVEGALADAGWNRLARAWLLPVEVEVALALDDPARARAGADELAETARLFASPVLQAAAASAAGRIELAEGSAAACATLRTAVQRWVDLGAPYEAATARLLLGRACRQAGDEGGARTALDAAAEQFDRLGAARDARHARVVRAQVARARPAGLTDRETEVLALVADGCTNKQIAARLHLSDKTVSRHLSNIFTKLGVSSRSAATAFAFQHGLRT